MTIETIRSAGDATPRLARWAAGGAAAALVLTAAMLWWSQGPRVFLDTLAAGLAWCF
jgi:hypothetical protein